MMDYEVVKSYGARIYLRINVACPDCNVILFCDQDHRDLIKETVEYEVYACILAPYEEWEVFTKIRNIIAKYKLKEQKKTHKDR